MTNSLQKRIGNLSAAFLAFVLALPGFGGPTVGVGNPGGRVFKSDKGFTLKVPKEIEVQRLSPSKYWLDNRRLLKPKDRKSVLEIEILRQGEKKASDRAPNDEFQGLRDLVRRKHPELDWNSLKFPGALAFAHERRTSDHLFALYYFETSSKLLIRAKVLAYPEAQGIVLVAPIIHSFGFDQEAPWIHGIKADPKVEAGGKGRLYIQATDDVAGLALTLKNDPANDHYCARFTSAHHRGQHFRACGALKPEPELGQDWYSVEFSPGIYLPADTYFLDRIQVRDRSNNRFQMGLMIQDGSRSEMHERDLVLQEWLFPASKLSNPNVKATGTLVACDTPYYYWNQTPGDEDRFWARQRPRRPSFQPVSIELIRNETLPPPDTSPPELISVAAVAGPWKAGQEAVLEIRATDAGSGMAPKVCIKLEHAVSGYIDHLSRCGALVQTDHQVYQFRFPLEKYLASGAYNLETLILEDQAGNQAKMTGARRETSAPATSFQIVNSAPLDRTAPVLHSFFLGKPLKQGETATLYFRASDNQAGVGDPQARSKFCAILRSPQLFNDAETGAVRDFPAILVCQKPQLSSGTSTQGVFKVSFEVPDHFPTGKYFLQSPELTDDAGNTIRRYFHWGGVADPIPSHYENSPAGGDVDLKVLITELKEREEP